MISAPVFCRRFIGRADELDLVRERYREALGAKSSFVIVSGEAGIGKTRLLRELRSALEREGALCAAGHCLQHTRSALAPFADILFGLDRALPHVLRGDSNLRAALSALLPCGEAAEAAPTQFRDQRTQFAALAAAFQAFAHEQPLFLAIEDLHWADLATIDCVKFLSARLQNARIVFALTYRCDEQYSDLLGEVQSLTRGSNVWELELSALAPDQTASLLRSALQGHQTPPLPLLNDIVRRSEGRPLLAEELLRHAVDGAGGDLPASVRALVAGRVAKLSEGSRSILAYAAVLGPKFTADFLGSVSGIASASIGEALRNARDLQLVVEVNRAAGTYEFRHVLMHEALYGELLEAEARPMHERIAQELEHLGRTDDVATELAHHWWAARNFAKAAEYAELAGDIAAVRFAHADAVSHYERALQCAPDGKTTAALLQKIASQSVAAGLLKKAIATLEQLLQTVDANLDPARTCEIMRELGLAKWANAEGNAALECHRSALDIIRPFPRDPHYLTALIDLARSYALIGDADAALSVLDETQRFSGAWPVGARIDYALYKGVVFCHQGRTFDAVQEYYRAIALADEGGSDEQRLRGRTNFIDLATSAGEFSVARSAFSQALALAKKQRAPYLEAHIFARAAHLEFLAGRLDLALQYVERAEELAFTFDVPFVTASIAMMAIPLALQLEDDELLKRYATDARLDELFNLIMSCGEAQGIVPLGAALAEVHLSRGSAEKAAALLERCLNVLLSVGAAPWFALHVAAHCAKPEVQRARILLAAWAHPEDNRMGRAFLNLFDAHVASEGSERVARATEAAQAFSVIGMPYYEAQALELAGRAGDALDIYVRMGAVREIHRLEREQARPNRRGRSKNELTARESQIAELVASGASNRSIAEWLTISERTVENHIAAIFQRLRVDSRAQLSAKLNGRPPTEELRVS